MKHRIKIGLNTRGGKTTNIPIRIRVTYEGNDRLDIHTGYVIDSHKWDTGKANVKQGYSNSQGYTFSEINRGLAERVMLIERIFTRCELNNVVPTHDYLRREYDAEFNSNKIIKAEKTFFDYFDDFMCSEGKKNGWTEDTHEKLRGVKAHLKTFDENLTFAALNNDGLNAYLSYLYQHMINETIIRQLGFLRWFLRWAEFNGYHNNTAYKAFRPKLKRAEKKIVYLTWDELMCVYYFEIPETKKYLAQVRDVFCFSCFTSLRYSDVYNLRRSNIKEGHIDLTTIKTVDNTQIELNKYSKAILDKYANIPFKDNKALPVISNQKMNDYLKELGQMCGLDEPITQTHFRGNTRVDVTLPKFKLLSSHSGRRTFICNALSLGISPSVVMAWTGHSDYKAMKPYIAITDAAKKNAMAVFDRD